MTDTNSRTLGEDYLHAVERANASRYEAVEKQVHTLADVVTGLVGRMGSIETSLENIAVNVKRLSTPRQTNWIAIATLVLAVIVGGAQYVNLTDRPILEEQVRQHDAIVNLNTEALDRARIIGEAVARLEYQSRIIDLQTEQINAMRQSLSNSKSEISGNSARLVLLGRQIESIDNDGSRVWNKRDAPKTGQ